MQTVHWVLVITNLESHRYNNLCINHEKKSRCLYAFNDKRNRIHMKPISIFDFSVNEPCFQNILKDLNTFSLKVVTLET